MRKLLLMTLVACFGALQGSFAGFTASSPELSGIRTYPCPWRSDKHAGLNITFDQLPNTPATIRIFTISGEHVRTIEGVGSVTWDHKNGSGQEVASGVYIYLVETAGMKKTGKLAVIR